MSVPFLVSDIQAAIVFRADLPTPDANTNVSTGDMLILVQESARRLTGQLNDISPEGYFNTTATLTTTANVPIVSLPASFDKLIQIHWVKTDGTTVELDLAALDEVGPTSSTANGWDTYTVPKYRVTANTIEFFPKPTTVESIVVRYSTGMTVTSAADTLQAQNGWDEWIVLDACCKIRQRQGKDYSEFAAEKQLIQREIIKQAKRRDRHGIPRMRDAYKHDPYLDLGINAPWWRR